jgi:hypothetical protein
MTYIETGEVTGRKGWRSSWDGKRVLSAKKRTEGTAWRMYKEKGFTSCQCVRKLTICLSTHRRQIRSHMKGNQLYARAKCLPVVYTHTHTHTHTHIYVTYIRITAYIHTRTHTHTHTHTHKQTNKHNSNNVIKISGVLDALSAFRAIVTTQTIHTETQNYNKLDHHFERQLREDWLVELSGS